MEILARKSEEEIGSSKNKSENGSKKKSENGDDKFGQINDFVVSVRENGAKFMFDFSKVYWNPRLVTEHQKVVDLLKVGDFLFDVFAGVGPFSVPAAMKAKVSKKCPLGIRFVFSQILFFCSRQNGKMFCQTQFKSSSSSSLNLTRTFTTSQNALCSLLHLYVDQFKRNFC